GLVLALRHPVLWPHTESHVQLSFRGGPRDPAGLIGTLYRRHVALVEGWLSFQDFVHHDRLAGGFGVLATGPEALLREYAAVLGEMGIEHSFSGSRPPR